MEHSTLDPSGMVPPPAVRRPSSYKGGPVRVLMMAPFQYSYGSKSHWVTTGEWYSLDPIKDREEILYLQSSSNPYKQFIHIEGGSIGTDEEKSLPYSYGTGYPISDPIPPFRSNALIPNEDPEENPHMQEALARVELQLASPVPVPVAKTPVPISEDEVVPQTPDNGDRPPTYGEEVPVERPPEVIVMEDIEVCSDAPIAMLEVRPSKEDELRSMKASNIKALAASMGLEYKDKESAIRQILEAGRE